MKKSILFVMACLISISFAAGAMAEEKYFGANVGVSSSSVKVRGVSGTIPGDGATEIAAGLQLGRVYTPEFRTEVELGYKTSDVKLSAFNFTVIGFYDYKNPTLFGITPYVGIGGGVIFLVPDSGFNDKEYGFAYHGAAGAAYEISPLTTIDLGYRYVGSLAANTLEYASHNLMVGIRYKY